MGVGQPGVQRREPNLGAVAEQQEYEGNVEERRIEPRRVLDEAVEQLEDLTRLINDLIDLARGEEPRLPPRSHPYLR